MHTINLVRLGDLLLDVSDGLAGVQVFWAGLGAVHDGVAAVQLEGVVQLRQPLFRELVARVLDPPVSLIGGGGIVK